jgi:hypothetical protein
VSFKFTFILLAVAIVAIAGFGIAQRQLPSTNPSAAPAASPTAAILDMTLADVNNVDIKAGDKETVLTRDGSTWKLVKPSEDSSVDQTKVNQIVGQVASVSTQRSVAPANADLGPYGLRTPQLTVTLSGASGKKETLLVGDKNVNGNQYYAVRQEGSEVGLIPSTLVTALMDLANNPPRATPTPSVAASA